MSTVVDNRVVEMKFDNSNFESNVKTSMSTLEKLKSALNSTSGSKGLDQIAQSAKNVKVDGIASGVEKIQSRFSTLGVVGMKVLSNLTDTAMNVGKKLYSSTVGQVIQGGYQRAASIEQARFTLQGVLKDGDRVKVVMKEAMDSVDGTAYGFDQAALAASQFASSGVKSGSQMQHALAAVAGTAATTGKEYSWISQIFTRVAGQGKVMATDLNSMASAGTNAAVEIANYINGVNSGAIQVEDSMKKMVQSVSSSTKLTESDIRDMVSKGKINFDIFSEAMNNAFGEHAKDANKTFSGAMDNVKARLKQMGQKFFLNYEDDGPMGILNENSPVVGFLNALMNALAGLKNAIDPLAFLFRDFVNSVADAGTAFLKLFDTTERTEKGIVKNQEALTFFTDLVKGITNIAQIFVDVLSEIGHAFMDVFPSANIKTLSEVATKFKDFTHWLMTSVPIATVVGNVFKILFSVLRIGWTVVKNILMIFSPFVKLLPGATKGVAGITGVIANSMVKLSDWIARWDGIAKVVKKVTDALDTAKKYIQDNVFSKFSFGDGLDNATGVIGRFIQAIAAVREWIHGLDPLVVAFGEAGNGIAGAVNVILTVIREFITCLITFCGSLTGNDVTQKIKDFRDAFFDFEYGITDFIYSIEHSGEKIKNFFKGIKETIANAKPSLDSAKESFKSFAESVMQVLRPLGSTLKTIAQLIGDFISRLNFKAVLAAAGTGGLVAYIYNLIKIGSRFTGMFKQFTSMVEKNGKHIIDIFYDVGDTISALRSTLYHYQKTLDAKALTGIAGAVALLALALFVLSTVDGASLQTAVLAIGELFAMLVGSMKLLAKMDVFGKVTQIASVMVVMSLAVLILASAVKKLSKLNPEQVVVGVLAIAGLMGALLVMMQRMPEKKLAGAAAGMILMAIAVRIIAGAVKKLGSLSIGQVAQGILAVGIALAEFAAFTHVVKEKKLAGIGVGLILVSVAMRIMAGAIKKLGSLSIGQVAQGLLAMGIALAAFAAFTHVVKEGKLIGIAIAMGVMGVAMLVVAQAVKSFGNMDLLTVSQGLLAVVVALGAFAAFSQLVSAGKLVAAAVGIAGVSLALLVLSAAVERFTEFNWSELGRGAAAFAGALILMAAFSKVVSSGKLITGAAGILIMGFALTLLVSVVERFAGLDWNSMVKGIIGMAAALVIVAVATNMMSGAIVGAISLVIVAAALNLLVIPIEKLGKMKLGSIVKALLGLAGALLVIGVVGTVLGVVSPLLLAFGVALLAVGAGIALVGVGLLAIAASLSAFAAAGMAGIAVLVAGIKMIVALFPYIGEQIGLGLVAIIEAVLNAADTIIEGVVTVGSKLLAALATLIPQVANLVVLLLVTILNTIATYMPAITSAAGQLIINFINGIAQQLPGIITAATNLILAFMIGIAMQIPTIVQAGMEIVVFLIEGLSAGIEANAEAIAEAMRGLGHSMLTALKTVLGINSPSTEMYDIGDFSMQGLLNGLEGKESEPGNVMSSIGSDMLTQLQGAAPNSEFSSTGSGLIASLASGMSGNTDTGSSGMEAALNALTGASEESGEFNTTGSDLMSMMASGMDSKAPDVSTSTANAAKQGAQAVKPYQAQFQAAGVYLMLGLVKGIKSKAGEAAKAAAAAGKAAVAALQDSIKQGSPSKLTYESGKFFGMGFINGIKRLTESVGRAAGRVGDKAVTEMNDAIDKIIDIVLELPDDDWNPKITPVVDLSNVSDSARSIDNMLSSSQALNLAGTANVQMNADDYETSLNGMKINNVDVVKAIGVLSDDIDGLKDVVSNLRVYMDTGALVGEIRDPMDKALGVKAARQRRGG